MPDGKFITIEGIEGAGKSTTIHRLGLFLKHHGIDHITTREPGGTVVAEAIRQLLLGDYQEPVDDITELLLIFASRRQHVRTIIIPALQQGKWVLCDRFTDATYAYQGSGRRLPITMINQLHQMVHNTLNPDLTLLLDLDVTQGLTRASKRSSPDRIEKQANNFFERVRQGYLKYALSEPNRFRIIDATESQTQVMARIEALMQPILDSWRV
jgi:dTMP kinase